MTLKRKSSPARPKPRKTSAGRHQLSPQTGSPGFKDALLRSQAYYQEILPKVEQALLAVEGRVVDDQILKWSAETLAQIISSERHFEAGEWFKPQPPKELERQITALADALEAYRSAARGLGIYAGNFVWPWPTGTPLPDNGRKYKRGNDKLASLVVDELPGKLAPMIELLRDKAKEALAKNATGRGRPLKADAIMISNQAGFEYLQLTRERPGYSKSRDSNDGGPFARLVKRLFEIAGIQADYRNYAEQAVAKMGVIKRMRGR